MIEKETVDGAFKNHNGEFLVVFNIGDDFPELQNKFRTHEVKRRIVEYHSPVGRRLTSYVDLLSFSFGCRIHRGLPFQIKCMVDSSLVLIISAVRQRRSSEN